MSFLRVSRLVTIERHIAEEQEFHPSATGEYSRLLRDLTLALRIIARDVRRAGLNDVLGITDSMNVHGETVKKLDEFANEVIFRAMDHGGHLCVMASEESEGIIKIPDEYAKGKYVLLFDPLDGSSNIDVNTTIGTIFSNPRKMEMNAMFYNPDINKLPRVMHVMAVQPHWSILPDMELMSSPMIKPSVIFSLRMKKYACRSKVKSIV